MRFWRRTRQSSEVARSRGRVEHERDIRNRTQAMPAWGLSAFLRATRRPGTAAAETATEGHAKIYRGAAQGPAIDADGRATDRASGDRETAEESYVKSDVSNIQGDGRIWDWIGVLKPAAAMMLRHH